MKILINAAKCLLCKTIAISTDDTGKCKCGNVIVSGGNKSLDIDGSCINRLTFQNFSIILCEDGYARSIDSFSLSEEHDLICHSDGSICESGCDKEVIPEMRVFYE